MSTIGGILVALIGIVVATIMDGNSFGALIGPSSLVLVMVGTIGVSVAGARIADVKRVPKGVVVSVTAKEPDLGETVDELMRFTEVARKEGVLALEPLLEELDDPFLRAGLQQIVDGADADAVRDTLEIEMQALDERHQPIIAFFKTLGGYAPTMGMIGTVVGLINMLGNLTDPAQLGIGMSVALLTTLYGVIFANLVFLPIAAKLSRLHALELAQREVAMDGILAVQAGASPRALVERLESYLSPAERIGHQERSRRGSGIREAA